jgi:hypothetical protein
MLVLFAPGVLWLWTTTAHAARRNRSARLPSPAQRTQQAQRKQPQRSAPAEVGLILTVERRGVPTGILCRRIPLGAAGSAAALALPAHRGAVAREAETVAEQPAAQHEYTR